jgi:hypothetical protein
MQVNVQENEPQREAKRMIALELPESLYQKLRKAAYDREVSLSAIVRLIVDGYFLDLENQDNC